MNKSRHKWSSRMPISLLWVPILVLLFGEGLRNGVEAASTSNGREKMRSNPRVGMAQPAASCSFDGPVQPRCTGIFDFQPGVTLPTKEQLKAATLVVTDPPINRYGDPKCNQPVCFQEAQPLVNSQARAFPEDLKLPQGKALVMGAMTLDANGIDEKRYKIGKKLGNSPEERQVYFVAYSLPNPGPKTGTGQVVLGWQMFTILPNGQTKRGGTGSIVKCDEPTPNLPVGDDTPYATFTTCNAAHATREVAVRLGTSIQTASLAFGCHISPRSLTPDTHTAICSEQLDYKLNVLARFRTPGKSLGALMTIPALKPKLLGQDLAGDPYWFSCASGCCTADK